MGFKSACFVFGFVLSFYQTLFCRATILFTAAFILGGEELLRTKDYVEAGIDPDTVSGVTADSWTAMFNHKISHNSYNAPLKVNSFKWENKVRVKNDGLTLENSVYHYVEAFAGIIKSHKDLLKKRGENNGYGAFVSKTSADKDVWNRYWSEDGNFSNCVAFQANEAFVYTCAGQVNSGDYIVIDGAAIASWGNPLLDYGAKHYDEAELNIAHKLYFDQTNMIYYLDRHGK